MTCFISQIVPLLTLIHHPSPLSTHPSPFTSFHSTITPHLFPLIHHPSPLSAHPSPLTSFHSSITPHLVPITLTAPIMLSHFMRPVLFPHIASPFARALSSMISLRDSLHRTRVLPIFYRYPFFHPGLAATIMISMLMLSDLTVFSVCLISGCVNTV